MYPRKDIHIGPFCSAWLTSNANIPCQLLMSNGKLDRTCCVTPYTLSKLQRWAKQPNSPKQQTKVHWPNFPNRKFSIYIFTYFFIFTVNYLKQTFYLHIGRMRIKQQLAWWRSLVATLPTGTQKKTHITKCWHQLLEVGKSEGGHRARV